jgi:hypothetical protein
VLGEYVAFPASQLDVEGRRISVDRQIVETRSVMVVVRMNETDPRSGGRRAGWVAGRVSAGGRRVRICSRSTLGPEASGFNALGVIDINPTHVVIHGRKSIAMTHRLGHHDENGADVCGAR